MKRMYKIGLIASLTAMLPIGLFAGNGDGDGKDKKSVVTVVNSNQTDHLTLFVAIPENFDFNKVQIHARNTITYLNHINYVANGIEIGVDIDHSGSSTGNGDDDVIIIEIVGVDNITGVDATDDNNGGNMPTSFTSGIDHTNMLEVIPTQDTPTGLHSNPTGSLTTVGQIQTVGKEDIQIYPNPVRSETNVVTVGEILGKTIQIMDLSGNTVLTTIVGAGSRQTVLDLSALTPGLYILSYTTEDGKTISKRIQKV